MIQPRWPLGWGACLMNWAQAYLHPRKTLRLLILMTLSHVSSVISCTIPWFSVPPMPALLTITSNLPPASTAAWTNASTSVPTVTFVFTNIPLFSPCRRHITSFVGVPASSAMKLDLGVDFKSAQTTRWVPWAAKARATARPRPEDEPVTMHTLSLRRAPVGKVGVDVAIVFGGQLSSFETR